MLVSVTLPPASETPPYELRRRAEPRRVVERLVEVRQGNHWAKVGLKSVSRRGFEVGWFAKCQLNQPIYLKGSGLPSLEGKVVWSDNLTVRCELQAPMHDAVLKHISRALGISDAP